MEILILVINSVIIIDYNFDKHLYDWHIWYNDTYMRSENSDPYGNKPRFQWRLQTPIGSEQPECYDADQHSVQ